MKRATIATLWVLLILFVSLSVAPARAQDAAKPDLSGTWTLNVARSKNATDRYKSPHSMTIISSGQSIQIQSTFKGGHSVRKFIADGKEHVVSEIHSDPVVTRGYSRAFWKDSTLVIEFRTHIDDPDHPNIPNPDGHFAERFSLSSDGRVLTNIVDGLTSGNIKQILFYDKQ